MCQCLCSAARTPARNYFSYLLLFRVVPAVIVVLITWAVLHLVFGRRGGGFK